MMNVMEFAYCLFVTEDLDPVYCLLARSGRDRRWLAHFCLCYWCFYDVGYAAWLADSYTDPGAYYTQILTDLDSIPRGAERRHFRGNKARKAIESMERIGSPAAIVTKLFIGGGYASASSRVQQLPMFGPWIAWKACDMAERVLGYQIDFSRASLSMYKDPTQGAALLLHGDWRASITEPEVEKVARVLGVALRKAGHKAPPANDRPVNIQEVETVLCKYKAYRKGHYWPGKDIKDIRESLTRAGQLDLLEACPREVPR